MPTNIYEGWEGSFLYKLEVTPGTPVVPDTDVGIVSSVSARSGASLEAIGGIGTHRTVFFDEGLNEIGGSVEFLPISNTELEIAKRNASGRLNSYSIHAADGALGVTQTGCKINQLRFMLDAGGRLRTSMDWFALGSNDAARITPVVPTEEVFAWYEAVTNLSAEVASIEIVIAHNLRRVPVIPGSTYAAPVTNQKRGPYVIKEGRQAVTSTVRFFERPTYDTVATLITEVSTLTLTVTGNVDPDGGGLGVPETFVVTLSNGKPNTKELTMSEGAEAGWPMEILWKDWTIA